MPEHRFEHMLPSELEAARGSAFVPMGAYEWHGRHLPVGLDGLTAHGVCMRAAERTGGVVLPTLYYGTGGGHAAYPWTIMMPGELEIAALLEQTLARLEAFGMEKAVLFSGHYAREQIDLVRRIAEDWNVRGGGMRALGLTMYDAPAAPFNPDHAAIFETTLLGALHPERVRIDELPTDPANDPEGSGWGDHRHDPAHPLYGIFGADPRAHDPAQGPALLAQIVAWLVEEASK